MQSILTSSRRPALRQGLIFGVALGIIEVLFSYVSQVVQLGFLSTLIAYGLYLVFGLIAGLRAAEQTGRTKTGVVAGLWTGLFSSLISSIVSFILTIVNINSIIVTLQDAARKATPPQDPQCLYDPGGNRDRTLSPRYRHYHSAAAWTGRRRYWRFHRQKPRQHSH